MAPLPVPDQYERMLLLVLLCEGWNQVIVLLSDEVDLRLLLLKHLMMLLGWSKKLLNDGACVKDIIF